MTYLVVGGLVLLVGLVVVLVALGMRAGRAHDDDDDDWMTDEPQQQRPRRPGAEAAPGEEEAGYDLRVAGAPLAAPVPSAPAAAPRRGKATQEMGDDDYWATITFDKPKFPWQHENGGQPPADAPLHSEPEPEHVAAAVDDPFADGYGQGYAEQEYDGQPFADQPVAFAEQSFEQFTDQPYADQTYADQTFTDQPYVEQPYADQTYGDQTYADQTYADQTFSEQPFAEPQPFSEPAFGEYRDDYADQFREPVDIPVAGHAGAFEPEPLPLRPDPLEPSALDWPAPPQPTSMPERSYEQTTIDRMPPVERPTAPKSDPLGLPEYVRPAAARADNRDPEATQSYPVPSPYSSGPINPNPLNPNPLSPRPLSTGPLSGGPRSTGPQNMGPLGGQSPLNKQSPLSPQNPLSGQSPLSTTGPLIPPPVSANPLSTSYTPEPQSPTDTDGQRLPTVDELLQKIQADRRKTETPTTTSYNAGSLNDPLNDPLASGERDPAYGSSWSKPAAPAAPSRNYDSDPLSGGTPGYGGSYGSEGYPSTPAYGEPRYDDPLAGYQSGTPSAGSYPGSYAEGAPEPGRYGDFTGSSFNGAGGEPGQAQNPQNGQTPPNAGGYYPDEQGFYGAPTPEPPHNTPPAYPSSPYEKQPASSEEWDSYRDYRH